MDLLEMRWEDVWFAHWAVDPEVLAQALPQGLTVDTYEGQAYLGIVGFQMSDIRPRGLPVGLSFLELNLRTYVDGPAGPGVYFFSLDADDPIGVSLARTLFQLPYSRARATTISAGEATVFRSNRVHRGAPTAGFEASYEPTGTQFEAEAGSLPAFLVERYQFYVADEQGQTYVGAISHPPWQLQEADLEIRRNDLFAANGFERPGGEPHVLFSPDIRVSAERLRSV
jgi:uncharacterized protein YqjF (DUF2071 family)